MVHSTDVYFPVIDGITGTTISKIKINLNQEESLNHWHVGIGSSGLRPYPPREQAPLDPIYFAPNCPRALPRASPDGFSHLIVALLSLEVMFFNPRGSERDLFVYTITLLVKLWRHGTEQIDQAIAIALDRLFK
jgi:hypothetical protein